MEKEFEQVVLLAPDHPDGYYIRSDTLVVRQSSARECLAMRNMSGIRGMHSVSAQYSLSGFPDGENNTVQQ